MHSYARSGRVRNLFLILFPDVRAWTMASSVRHLLIGGLIGATVFGLVFLAAGTPDRHKSLKDTVTSVPEYPAKEEAQQVFRPTVAATPETPTRSPENVPPIAPLPSDAPSVPDACLLNLAAMVDLSQAGTHRPDKNRWRQAIPVAEKLIQGPCDCAQRVWLTRFIEMGNFALENSENEYYEHATLLASLGRNDDQAMALSRARN
jgi:hypothetical protein